MRFSNIDSLGSYNGSFVCNYKYSADTNLIIKESIRESNKHNKTKEYFFLKNQEH